MTSRKAIDAEFKNELLTIDLPKTEVSKLRTIQVRSKEK
jgi:HSP20 family molecular chaperone IbpA